MHGQTSAPNTIEYSKPIQDRHTSPSHQKSWNKVRQNGEPGRGEGARQKRLNVGKR